MFFLSGCHMFAKPFDLTWEWPAGRMAQQKLLVKTIKVEKASSGLFGIGASPSMAHALPDATDVTVQVIDGPAPWTGQTLRIQLPGVEAQKLARAPMAGLGLLNNTTCICLTQVPEVVHDTADWFKHWACP